MPDALADLLAAHGPWVLPVFLTVLATAAAAAIARVLLHRLQRRLARTRTPWDDAALRAADTPLQALAWILGLNVAANLVLRHTGAELFRHADAVRALLLILVIAWFLLRFVNQAEQQLIRPADGHGGIDLTTARAIAKVLRMSIIITAVLVLLQKLGYSVSGVLAFGGVGGIAVGFAARDLLANFFGGLMIFLDRPFSIGDWVRSPDRELEGTVEYIGWRLTRIRTAEMRPLYVPNSTFASIAVENVSRMTHRRISQGIGLRYEDWPRLPAIIARIRALLEQHPGIAHDQALMVSFEKFGESSLGILLHAFTASNDWAEFHRVRQDILLAVLDILAEEGAELAVPTRQLLLDPGAGVPGHARADAAQHRSH